MVLVFGQWVTESERDVCIRGNRVSIVMCGTMLSATSSSVANRKIRNTVPPADQATAIARARRVRRPPIPNFRNRYRTWSRLMPNSSPARA